MTERIPWLAFAYFVVGVLGLFFYRRDVQSTRPRMAIIVPADMMLVTLSIGLTGASLFIILSKYYRITDKNWASATVGTILGFWLRGRSK